MVHVDVIGHPLANEKTSLWAVDVLFSPVVLFSGNPLIWSKVNLAEDAVKYTQML